MVQSGADVQYFIVNQEHLIFINRFTYNVLVFARN